ncbi:DoxX family protein [Novosphingobium sp. JCM 18896]|uniref:DoxX family protein n=1 Tax=Novosphingobium sp. JCM 18896 TaxID=2989731 RepID=UPI0029CA8468|nr:DoxX family protein [Novosphingobium sp. JCM 18896]
MISPASLLQGYDAAVRRLSGAIPESLLLLFLRVVFGGIFWRSGQTKVADGSWFTLNDNTVELFRTEYAGVPLLPPELAATMANAAEHLLPALLCVGLFTRASAFGLLVMTLVIQVFVYPEAWWPEHSLWTGLALVLVLRGGGLISLDALLVAKTR